MTLGLQLTVPSTVPLSIHPSFSTADQNTIRRRGAGLRAFDHYRLCPGYTLFTPAGSAQEVYLIDLKGRMIQEWQLPYPPISCASLLPNGNLFYNGTVRADRNVAADELPTPNSSDLQGSLGVENSRSEGVVAEIDRRGNVVWEYRHPNHHYDACCLRNGNFLIFCIEKLPPTVKLPSQEQDTSIADEAIYGHVLHEVTPEGHRVWSWYAYEHLDSGRDWLHSHQDCLEWVAGNSVQELSDGHILISSGQHSTMAIIDRATGQVVWQLGQAVLTHQQRPQELPNGHFLILDHCIQNQFPFQHYSRVIEVDRLTQTIVWEYHDRRPSSFFSPNFAGVQRLSNGNTLITEGDCGRFFEITPEGDIVWEYINPHFHPRSTAEGDPPHSGDEENTVFGALRYLREEITWL
ncbi:aryl-sulfate sulfotransferase [Alkalinema sp. FACHB-956]|uniref:aryl-sulfate sulfotransferase n=1 Tax=Alkalinema sp. FACHB-956 TaxID=2692768 RepID=UPI00168701FC|nr:aryl-sulfate sulfotransferase [Alkalinema sp. FACHB-956]MBD2329254.1 aryl-sulfate sulfotransferase [Alkalinema sp. FACHB-956]